MFHTGCGLQISLMGAGVVSCHCSCKPLHSPRCVECPPARYARGYLKDLLVLASAQQMARNTQYMLRAGVLAFRLDITGMQALGRQCPKQWWPQTPFSATRQTALQTTHVGSCTAGTFCCSVGSACRMWRCSACQLVADRLPNACLPHACPAPLHC